MTKPNKNRIKQAVSEYPVPANRSEVEQVLAEMAAAKNVERALVVLKDERIAAVNAEFAPDLEACLTDQAIRGKALQAWAEGNPGEFGKLKSIEFPSGKLGFRTGMPQLKPRKKFNWAVVLDILKQRWSKYVRTKEEPDKEGLLAAYSAGTVNGEALAEMGLQCVQEETFYVDPKLTEVETRSSQPVKGVL